MTVEGLMWLMCLVVAAAGEMAMTIEEEVIVVMATAVIAVVVRMLVIAANGILEAVVSIIIVRILMTIAPRSRGARPSKEAAKARPRMMLLSMAARMRTTRLVVVLRLSEGIVDAAMIPRIRLIVGLRGPSRGSMSSRTRSAEQVVEGEASLRSVVR